MTITEEHAKRLWCPFATTSSIASGQHGAGIYDTRGQSKGFTNCIAGDCMAWRWYKTKNKGYCKLIGK